MPRSQKTVEKCTHSKRAFRRRSSWHKTASPPIEHRCYSGGRSHRCGFGRSSICSGWTNFSGESKPQSRVGVHDRSRKLHFRRVRLGASVSPPPTAQVANRMDVGLSSHWRAHGSPRKEVGNRAQDNYRKGFPMSYAGKDVVEPGCKRRWFNSRNGDLCRIIASVWEADVDGASVNQAKGIAALLGSPARSITFASGGR